MDHKEQTQYDIDFETALVTGNILAAEYIIKEKKLGEHEIRKSFILTLTHGNHEMASWLETLPGGNICFDQYGQTLFESISDKTVEWIFKQVKFTEIFRICYLDACKNDNKSLLDKLKDMASCNNMDIYISF